MVDLQDLDRFQRSELGAVSVLRTKGSLSQSLLSFAKEPLEALLLDVLGEVGLGAAEVGWFSELFLLLSLSDQLLQGPAGDVCGQSGEPFEVAVFFFLSFFEFSESFLGEVGREVEFGCELAEVVLKREAELVLGFESVAFLASFVFGFDVDLEGLVVAVGVHAVWVGADKVFLDLVVLPPVSFLLFDAEAL